MNGSIVTREYECLCTGCMYPRNRYPYCKIKDEKIRLFSFSTCKKRKIVSNLMRPDPKTKQKRDKALEALLIKGIRDCNRLGNTVYQLIDIFLFGGSWSTKIVFGESEPHRSFLSPFDYTYANYSHPFCLVFFIEMDTLPNWVDTQNIVNLKKALNKLKKVIKDDNPRYNFLQNLNLEENSWDKNETATHGVIRIMENKDKKVGEQSYNNWMKHMGLFLVDIVIWLRDKKLTHGKPIVWSPEKFFDYMSSFCDPYEIKRYSSMCNALLFREYCPMKARKIAEKRERRRGSLAFHVDEFGDENW